MAHRLLSNEGDKCTNSDVILRLVSNDSIDNNKVPQHLHHICASISLNDRAKDADDADEDSPVIRTITIDLLEKYPIVISTCVGIGILQGKSVSSQCHGKIHFSILRESKS